MGIPAAITITTKNAAVVTDYNTHANAALLPYLNVFLGTPTIAEAMDYDNLAALIRTDLWQAIDDAHGAGGVADVADPAGLPVSAGSGTGNVAFTQVEARESYVAMVAHAIYIDATGAFPWRLSSYSQAETDLLFDPVQIFGCTVRDPAGAIATYGYWDYELATEAEYALMFRVCAHSPSRAYTIATTILGTLPYTGNQRTAFRELTENAAGSLVHSTGGDDDNIATIDVIHADGISRTGCHCVSRYMNAVCRSVNIPAQLWYDYYDDGSHATSAFPTLGFVAEHADHMYEAAFLAEPLNLYGDHANWVANIIPTTPPNAANALPTTTGLHTRRLLPPNTADITNFQLPSAGWDHVYGAGGSSIMSAQVPTNISLAQVQAFYALLSAITGSDGYTLTPP